MTKKDDPLQKYKKFSGEKRVRIALSLSKLVRKVYNEGKLARENKHGKRPRATS